MWCCCKSVAKAVSIKGSVVARKWVPTSYHRKNTIVREGSSLHFVCSFSSYVLPSISTCIPLIRSPIPFLNDPNHLTVFTFAPCSCLFLWAKTELYKYILPHFPGMKDCFCLPFLPTQTQISMCILSPSPVPPCVSSHLCLFILL